MSDNNSFNDGLYGLGPSANTDWNSYNQGKSIHDMNQAELARQQAASSAWSAPSSFDFSAPTLPAPASSPSGVYTGGGSVEVGGGARFIGAVVMMLFTFWAVPLLYPITVAAAVGAGAAAVLILGQFAPDLLGPFAIEQVPRGYFVVLGVSLVAFWIVSRIDHRLARRARLYRGLRHLLRLFAFGALAWVRSGDPSAATPFPPDLQFLQRVFTGPAHLGTVVVVMLVMHLVLTRATLLRETWRGTLEALWLRPRRFAARQ